MGPTDVLDVGRDAIYVMLQVSAPVMLVGLGVGLIIALFQALTQIQEMTLTFVPKLIAMLAMFWVSMSFMTQSLSSFFTTRLVPLIAGI